MSHAMQGHPRWKGHSETSDKIWSTGGGMGNHSSILVERTPWTVCKGKKYRTLENEQPRKEDIQTDTGEEWRAFINSSRKNEVAGLKQKWSLVMDVSGNERKIWCCKEEYYIGIWNVMSMKQGKLEVVKQEMLRVSINILDISELK